MSVRTSVLVLLALSLFLGLPERSAALECSSKMIKSIRPVPPKRSVAIERHAKIKAAFPGFADDVIIGDSMAQRWPRKKLDALFNSEHVLNLGVRSDRTQNILWRMKDLPLSNLSPDRTVLFAGTNNLADDATPCEILEGIDSIVSNLKAAWPRTKVFVVQILPRGFDGFTFRDADRRATNSLIAAAATRKGFTFITVDEHALTCANNPVGTCPNFIHDQTHLSVAGYDFMNHAVETAFQNLQ